MYAITYMLLIVITELQNYQGASEPGGGSRGHVLPAYGEGGQAMYLSPPPVTGTHIAASRPISQHKQVLLRVFLRFLLVSFIIIS